MKYNIDDLISLNIAGIGYKRLEALIDYFGSLEKAIASGQDHLQRIRKIGPLLAQKICMIKDKDRLKKEWGFIKKHKVSILSIFDKGYPDNLKEIYDPPIVLYVKGRLIAKDKIALALIGSRKASLYGLEMCQGLSRRLAALGVTVVSGLARGIDSAAHKGALTVNGRTLAVFGSGLGVIYPPENRRLADEIVDSGALISEFPMGTPPMPRNFPIRNRIISGLSLGVVIVEATRKSGALITANCALEQGREVFAVPGRAGATTSTGTHWLIKEGAKLVEDVDDIVDELNLAPSGKIHVKSYLNKTLKDTEKRIYGVLSDEPEHIDSIISKAGLPAKEVMDNLLKLEVKRLIKQLPGKNFITIN